MIHRITTRPAPPALPTRAASGRTGAWTAARHAPLPGYVPVRGGAHMAVTPRPVTGLYVTPVSGASGSITPLPAVVRPAAFLPMTTLGRQPARATMRPVLMRAALKADAIGRRATRMPLTSFPYAPGKALSPAGGADGQSVTIPAHGIAPMLAEGNSTGINMRTGYPAGLLPAGLPAFRPDHTDRAMAGRRSVLGENLKRIPSSPMPPFHPVGGQVAWGRKITPIGIAAGTGQQTGWERPAFISPLPIARPDISGHGGTARSGPAPVVQVTIPLKLDHHTLGLAVARIDTNHALHEHRATGTAPDVLQYPQMPGRSIGR